MYDIIIFGGGLAGLTLAHELIKQNFKILVIEKDDELGGMARSDTKRNLLPSEHSWRGYAPFYKNTFQIMKEIPYYDSNVFNNLSIPIEFYLLYDKEYNYKSSLSIKDNIILYYIGINYLLSDNRREYYYSYNIEPFLKKNLSNDGYNYIINFITGPGYGMNKNEISMGHLFHFPVLSYGQKEKYKSVHSLDGHSSEHKPRDG
jgi:protoporphyrinogen oxidase